jgi:ADP-heptose:LPS heptosyltransferase
MRRWPDENFVALLRHLRQTALEVDVLVISAPNEKARALEIVGAGGARYAPTKTLRDALALVATANMLITPDTGIGHSASAFGTPAVIMFESGNEKLWGGYKIPVRNVVSNDKTLATLPIEPVLAAVDDLLQNMSATLSRSR